MTGLEPTTVAVAAPIIADAMGIQWPGERKEVLHHLNDYRNLIFNRPEGVEIFSNVFHCICVSEFREQCGTNECSPWNAFHGFSLPSDVSSIVGAWESGDPLVLRSRWRETRYGRGSCGRSLELTETARQYATERDPNADAVKLKVHAAHPDDADKVMVVTVIDADWKTVKLEFTFLADGWAVAESHARQVVSVALPGNLQGEVTIAQEDGYELSIYDPWETAPAYRRFKVGYHAANCPTSVLVQGIKRFRKVWFDHDIVEVGDPRVIQAAGRHFKHGNNSTDAKDLRRAASDLATMGNELAGVIARNRGRSVQDGNPARGRRITRSTRLPGY